MAGELHLPVARRFTLASRIAAAVVGVAAFVVLTGWVARIPAFAGLLAPSGATSMKANSALALSLLSAALLLSGKSSASARTRAAIRALAGIALGVAWFTLAEYATGISLGIDELLARDPADEMFPGRMAPSTAAAIALLATTILLGSAPGRAARLSADAAALAAAAFGLLGVVGYALGVPVLYALTRGAEMALLTSLAVLLLGAATVLARPERGVASLLAGDSAGGVMARRLLVPAIFLPIALGWVALESVRSGVASEELSLAAYTVSIVLAFVLLVISNAGLLHRADVERKLAEYRLKGESRFRALLEAAPDAIVIADQEGQVAIVNSRAEQVFGYRRDELANVPVSTLLPTASAAPGTASHDTIARRKDGGEFPVDVRVSPLESAEGTLRTYVVRDLTERKKAESERLATMAQLKELERLKEIDAFKTEFINTAAHELGTPLTPIKVQLHLLKSSRGATLAPSQRNAVDILDRNVARLSHLVQDMLDVARLQASRLGLVRRATDLNQLVLDAAESFRDAAKQGGVSLETQLTPGLVVEADEKRLTQVVYNLVSNALKFTPANGRIVVETSESKDHAVVRVRDSGIGISTESMTRLFRPFSQVHDTSVRNPAGTGLGLYISRGIVELHGGRLTVESDGHGRGATFTIHIPFRAPPPPLLAESAPRAAFVAAKQPEKQPESTVARRAKELV